MTSTNTPNHDPTEPTDAAILAAAERGDEIFDELEGEEDPGGVAYSLWICLTRLLASTGWSAEELARDAGWHAEHQGTLDAAGGTA